MHARVLQAMAQFVLVPYHGAAPILEMARAYGLRPRLWLLIILVTFLGRGGEESDHFSGKNGALRWSILVGK